MRLMVIRALAILQLIRIPLALAVGSDMWLATLLTRWNPAANNRPAAQMELWIALTIAALIGGGLLGFAAGMNDLLDVRRDQATNPTRPLPAGRVRKPHAALVTFGSLVTALIASMFFGEDSLHVALLAAAGIVAWNTFGRHIPAIGIPMMGLAHAGVMFIPWPGQSFTLPACLVFAQTIVTTTLLHQRSGKRPVLNWSSTAVLVLTSLACIAGLVVLGFMRNADAWPPPNAAWLAVFPLLAIAWFAWLLRAAIVEHRPAESSLLLQRAIVAAPPATAAAWALSLERPTAAAAFAGTAAICWTLAYLAREIHGMLAAPPVWRG